MSELLLTGGHVLLDGAETPISTDLLIRDGEIAAFGADAAGGASADADRHDLTGRTVLPGFIDAHVHLMVDGLDSERLMVEPFSLPFYQSVDTMRRTLDLGITTVRDAGGADAGLREAQRRGLVEGPELSIAVNILGQTGGHSDDLLLSGQSRSLFPAHPGRPAPVADGPDELRRRVRELMRAGADVIKICTTGGVSSETDDPKHSQFDAEELDVCVRTAALSDVPVMAHAQGKPGIMAALRAGVRSIEHGIYADDECFDLMRERGAWLVPTLIAPVALARIVQRGGSISEAVARKTYEVQEAHTQMMRAAVRAGVRIAFGTDAGVFPHGENLEEFELMHQAGMDPVSVLRSASQESAELLGFEDRGRIAVGMRADFAIVSGDAFDFTNYAERIAGVVQAGRIARALR